MTTRTYVMTAIVVVVAMLIGYTALSRLFWESGLPEGLIQANDALKEITSLLQVSFPDGLPS